MDKGFYLIKHNRKHLIQGGKDYHDGTKSVIFLTKTKKYGRDEEFMFYYFNNKLEKFQVGLYIRFRNINFLRKLENKEIIEYFFKSKSYGKKFLSEIKKL
jgi:hypothetical protein